MQYTIYKYSRARLALQLSNLETSQNIISKKKQFTYLDSYLSDLDVKSILVENDYISKDYIQDFSSYYVRCFKSYNKTCKRLHFFSIDLKKEYRNPLQAFQNPKSLKKFQRNYLGSVVVRPIPNSVIGFTILKAYNQNGSAYLKKLWGTKTYTIHLLGNKFCLNSLAFQEQDITLSACATISIWSMLQKAAEDYYVVLKSPGEITNETGIIAYNGNRLLPNKEGLVIPQMCSVIVKNGLQPETRIIAVDENEVINDDLYVRKLINAYSGIGLPIIMTIDIPNNEYIEEEGRRAYVGHAITIIGHKETKPALAPPKEDITWDCQRITSLYVHDDQIGPFTTVDLLSANRIHTNWEKEVGPDEVRTYITSLIIPVFPEIKISYDDIEPLVIGLDGLLSELIGEYFRYDIRWDLKLVFSEDYKSAINENGLFTPGKKLEVLNKSYPKYLWLAKCYVGNLEIIDVLLDATSLSGSMLGVAVVFYFEELKVALKEGFKDRKAFKYFSFNTKEMVGEKFFEFLQRCIIA